MSQKAHAAAGTGMTAAASLPVASSFSAQPRASLVPVVYSGSPAMAIRTTTSAPSLQDRHAADELATQLSALGCELLRVDASNRADLHPPGSAELITHVLYNKAYDAAELAQSLGDHASAADGFHAGFDLQALMAVGPAVWRMCDRDACLGRGTHPDAPTLRLFVDMAQLSEDTFRAYEQFSQQQAQNSSSADAAAQAAPAANKWTSAPSSTWSCGSCTYSNAASTSACEMCNAARSASPASALAQLPPPPPLPPAVPPPPESECPSSIDDAATFSVTTFNILSADYAAPSTFTYCDREDLAFSARKPRILATLASAVDGREGGSDIECCQEVDFDSVAEGMFDSATHGTAFLRRPHHKRDGCLIRWKESAFELMPLPEVIGWKPKEHRNNNQHAKHPKDTALVRVRCSNPAANVDRLGERVKRVSNAALASSPAAVAEAELLNRQKLLLHRMDELQHRLAALQARLPTATAVPAKPATAFFHAVQFNDLSLLTRCKHNSQSSLFATYKRENVALMLLLRARHSSAIAPKLVIACTAHLYWNEEFSMVKLHQAAYLLQHIEELQRQTKLMYPSATISVVLGGDFNSTPESKVYELLTRGTVPLLRANLGSGGSSLGPTQPPASPVPIVSSPFHDIVFASPSVGSVAEEGSKEEQAIKHRDAAAAAGHAAAPAVSAAASPSPPAAVDPASALPPADATIAASAASSSSSSSVTDSPNVRVKLLLDSTLLRITKWLRAIGVDTLCQSSTTPAPSQAIHYAEAPDPDPNLTPMDQFFALAKREGRIVVTQHKSLLRRRAAPASAYLLPSTTSKDPLDLFQEVVSHFGFEWNEKLFYSRCTTCNAVVEKLERAEYELLPFLPPEYALGVDDDGCPLVITRCTGSSCGRVRWWSSIRQLQTRQMLFQARLGVETAGLEDEPELDEWERTQLEWAMQQSSGGGPVMSAPWPSSSSSAKDGGKFAPVRTPAEELEERAERKAVRAVAKAIAAAEKAAAAGKGDKSTASAGASSSAASSSSTAKASAPAIPPTEAEVAAARAARKAARAETKADRAAAAASRREQTLARMQPSSSGPEDALVPVPVVHGPHIPAGAAAAAMTNVPRELHHQTAAVMMTPADAQALWWTADKKAHMLLVEKRITLETQKLLRQRKKEKADAAAAAAAFAAGGGKADAAEAEASSGSDDGNAEVDAPIAAVSTAPAAPSFASELHAYWQHVADYSSPSVTLGAPLRTMGPKRHEHRLSLASAYASCSPTGAEPAFTNYTPKFKASIDYLLFSRASLRVLGVRPLPTAEELEAAGIEGFPKADWPSDHLMLRATYEFLPSSQPRLRAHL